MQFEYGLMSDKVIYRPVSRQAGILNIYKEGEIIVITPLEETALEVRDIINIRAIAKKLCPNQKQLFLTDTQGQYLSISNRARKFISESNGVDDNRLAEAYVTDSLPMRIMVNHYVNANQPENPIKTFDSKEDAKTWLLGVFEN